MLIVFLVTKNVDNHVKFWQALTGPGNALARVRARNSVQKLVLDPKTTITNKIRLPFFVKKSAKIRLVLQVQSAILLLFPVLQVIVIYCYINEQTFILTPKLYFEFVFICFIKFLF
jgi:hypothetical protein